MKTNKVASIVVLVKGILMVLIGIIHTIALYFELQDALKNMTEYWAVQYAVWFGVTGMFWLFIGIIDLLSYSGIKGGTAHVWRIAFCSSIVPAVVVTPLVTYSFLQRDAEPAIIFPMMISFLAIVGTVVLVINHRKFTNDITIKN